MPDSGLRLIRTPLLAIGQKGQTLRNGRDRSGDAKLQYQWKNTTKSQTSDDTVRRTLVTSSGRTTKISKINARTVD